MICVDTTFLVHLWREKDLPGSSVRTLLEAHAGEDFAVPAHAAGEFLAAADPAQRGLRVEPTEALREA